MTNYRNFKRAIEKAQVACVNSGHEVDDHFADVRKIVTIGSGARRSVEDVPWPWPSSAPESQQEASAGR